MSTAYEKSNNDESLNVHSMNTTHIYTQIHKYTHSHKKETVSFGSAIIPIVYLCVNSECVVLDTQSLGLCISFCIH